jgi:Ca-activated chloride channel family protein
MRLKLRHISACPIPGALSLPRVAGVVLLALACCGLSRAQDAVPDATIRVDVRFVSIFVNVTDQNGAIVGGLEKENFRVTEDGKEQPIAVFERQSELPLNITLAIDTSGSVHKDLSEEVAAAKRFVRSILRPQDQMNVIEFATNVRERSGFTNKPGQIDHALGQLRSDFATALYEAISTASAKLGRRQGRKILVLITDGDNTVKGTSYDDALEAALRNETMIYPIIDVPIAASAGRNLGGEHALIALSEQTGGKYFYVSDGGLDKAFEQVSQALRTQYLLGYYPRSQEPGRGFHRIRVTIPRAEASQFNIRHKTGYFEDAPAGAESH